MESFGKQLRTLREKRHLTVNQLATYSGVSAAGISRIENGKRGVPKPATIKKLADALKIPYEELMQTAGYIETVQEREPRTTRAAPCWKKPKRMSCMIYPFWSGRTGGTCRKKTWFCLINTLRSYRRKPKKEQMKTHDFAHVRRSY